MNKTGLVSEEQKQAAALPGRQQDCGVKGWVGAWGGGSRCNPESGMPFSVFGRLRPFCPRDTSHALASSPCRNANPIMPTLYFLFVLVWF